MKACAIAVTAIILGGTVGAFAQTGGPYYSNTIHQSAGDRDARGTPKYNQGTAYHRTYNRAYGHSTTGVGTESGPPAGPYYSNSIHQSTGGRDSRGTPKYYGGR